MGRYALPLTVHTSHKQNELQCEKGDVVTLIDEPSGDYCQATAADGSCGTRSMSQSWNGPGEGVVLQPMPGSTDQVTGLRLRRYWTGTKTASF
ncbi:hypothetical protein GBAR_LOCUS10103 [Geodia barretti]|uniref:SH3 domain-containing protein n=1 Tax=Geodia barretti TaxID=519541 RepID=A0AA35RTV1_GEOBA|nr:hypothetical protein GBAR_LOCUS10103 [Geodia barretti]